jgi:hypothetical protein
MIDGAIGFLIKLYTGLMDEIFAPENITIELEKNDGM